MVPGSVVIYDVTSREAWQGLLYTPPSLDSTPMSKQCHKMRRAEMWSAKGKTVRVRVPMEGNVSGYVCNHGSPNGERDTASPRGRYGERLSVTRVWRYIFKNTTCWPATAHDVTTGVPQYKCRREDTSSASSSEACVRSMVQSLGDAVSRSPFGEPWLHT